MPQPAAQTTCCRCSSFVWSKISPWVRFATPSARCGANTSRPRGCDQEFCMAKVTRIHHIAIVVEDLDGPLSFWRDALGIDLTQVQDVPAEMAQIAFLPTQN